MMMIHKSVAPLATAILLVAGTSVLVVNPGHAQATDNLEAITLFKKHGFVIEGTAIGYALRAGAFVDVNLMARRIMANYAFKPTPDLSLRLLWPCSRHGLVRRQAAQ